MNMNQPKQISTLLFAGSIFHIYFTSKKDVNTAKMMTYLNRHETEKANVLIQAFWSPAI